MAGSIVQTMKRIYVLLTATTLLATGAARSQDAATEERIQQLNGKLLKLPLAACRRKADLDW